jgi:hypothetical protein
MTRTVMSSEKRKNKAINREDFINSPLGGRNKSTAGHTTLVETTSQKRGGD